MNLKKTNLSKPEQVKEGDQLNPLETILAQAPDAATRLLHGIVIGTLVKIDALSQYWVTYPGNPGPEPLLAKSTVILEPVLIDQPIALMFEQGRWDQPIIIGPIIDPLDQTQKPDSQKDVYLDGKKLNLIAQEEITLTCGKSSITLTKAGKILINSEYISSQAKGVNRLKGGAIKLN